MQSKPRSDSWVGLLGASGVIALWVSSLIFVLSTNLAEWGSLWVLPAILGRTFIQTGLFIVVHDAIHGSVFPQNRSLNHWIGSLAITLYGFLPYKKRHKLFEFTSCYQYSVEERASCVRASANQLTSCTCRSNRPGMNSGLISQVH